MRAEYESTKAASGLEVVLPMPRSVQRVSCMYDTEPKPAGSQAWDWQEKQRRLVWKFKKVPGATEYSLRVRRWALVSPRPHVSPRLHVSPNKAKVQEGARRQHRECASIRDSRR